MNLYTGLWFCFVLQRLPSTISNLKKLRVLDVEENKLDLLPPEIGSDFKKINLTE